MREVHRSMSLRIPGSHSSGVTGQFNRAAQNGQENKQQRQSDSSKSCNMRAGIAPVTALRHNAVPVPV